MRRPRLFDHPRPDARFQLTAHRSARYPAMSCIVTLNAIAASSAAGTQILELYQNDQGFFSRHRPRCLEGSLPTAPSSRGTRAGPTVERHPFHPSVSLQAHSHHGRCFAPALGTLREAGSFHCRRRPDPTFAAASATSKVNTSNEAPPTGSIGTFDCGLDPRFAA